MAVKKGRKYKKRRRRVIRPFTEEDFEALRLEQMRKRKEKIIKAAIKEGYYIEDDDLSDLTEEELRNLNRRTLKKAGKIRKVGGSIGELGARISRGEIAPLSAEEMVSFRETGRLERTTDEGEVISIIESPQSVFDSVNNEYIEEGAVFEGSEAKMQVDMLMNILEYGESYRGIKTEGSGHAAVNKSAMDLIETLELARAEVGDEEIIRRIEEYRNYGSVKVFAHRLERLVLAVYDAVYAEWGTGGSDAYDRDVQEFRNVIWGRI